MLLILIAIVFVSAGTAFLFRYTTQFVERTISRRLDLILRETELIVQTAQPPARWTTAHIVAAGSERTAKNAVIRKLRRLRKQFARSSLIKDETVRAEILAELDAVGSRWRDGDWSGITAPISPTDRNGP